MEDNKYKKIPVQFEESESYEIGDSRFIKCKIFLMHTGLNLNGSIFNKNVVEDAIPTLANTPILAYIEDNSDGEEDFSDHRIVVEIKNDNIKLSYKGKAIGVIPETNNAHFEMKMCEDGKEREFLVVDGLVWTKFDEVADIFNRDKSKAESMEIENCEGSFDRENHFVFSKFDFYGACALGKDVNPAMISASIDTVFATNIIKEKLDQFNNYVKNQSSKNEVDIDFKNNEEGGKKLNKETIDKILKEFSLTVEDVDFEITEDLTEEEFTNKLKEMSAVEENVESDKEEVETEMSLDDDKQIFSATYQQKREALYNALPQEVVKGESGESVSGASYYVEDFDDEYVYVEKYTWDENNSDYMHGRFGYTFDEESITATLVGEMETIVIVRLTEEENAKVQEERANSETMKTEFEDYKANYSVPNSEVEKLKEFQQNAINAERKEQEDSLFARFDEELSSIEAYSALKENAKDYNIDELEEKLFAMLGKKNSNFSATTKKNNKIPAEVFNTEKDEEDAYGGLLSKYYNK